MNGNKTEWSLFKHENIWENPHTPHKDLISIPLVALIRVRNEELIIADTLNHLATFADCIVAYEDASTDHTRQILKSHPAVKLIIENNRWEGSLEERLLAETRHRGLLLQEARKRFSFQWCMCCDADERYIGPIREFVSAPNMSALPDAVRVKLFDAYMVQDDQAPYQQGVSLLNFRLFFGPERRDILMLWKNSESVVYRGLDSREPIVPGLQECQFYCQHYGKSLSVQHWEETCDYYINHFPFELYGKKWSARKGRAIHTKSDFGRPLYRWGEELFANAVVNF